jgi:hypothetical protein
VHPTLIARTRSSESERRRSTAVSAGTYKYKSGSTYEGDFLDGSFNGHGEALCVWGENAEGGGGWEGKERRR